MFVAVGAKAQNNYHLKDFNNAKEHTKEEKYEIVFQILFFNLFPRTSLLVLKFDSVGSHINRKSLIVLPSSQRDGPEHQQLFYMKFFRRA